MSKNSYQPSFSTAASESSIEIRATIAAISEVNTPANAEAIVSRQRIERETTSARRNLDRRRWARVGREPSLAQTDLNTVRRNIHALSMPEIKRQSMLPNRVQRNPLANLWHRLLGKISTKETDSNGRASTQ